MSWFADQPVQRKLSFAMLLTSSVVLVLACSIFLAVQYADYKSGLESTVTTLARITANNVTAAVAYDDKEEVRQNLEALRAEPQIVAAILYDTDDRILANYAVNPKEVMPNHASDRPGLHFEEGYLIAVQPVAQGSRQLGTLYLQASMAQIYARMRTYGWIVLGVLVASFGLAGLIAVALRRTLARPILELANTAGAVSANQDYSLRARQYGQDELGRLTATFNAMLEKTQNAVGALRESEWAHRELVRALPTAAYMCDARGCITIYNDAAVALWGRAPELGLEYWCGSFRIYRADGSPLPLDQCPMAIALKEGRPMRGIEIIIERPDGTRRNVMPHPEPIRDTTGTVVGIVNMLVDITDQKRANAAVRQLAAIVESSEDAIVGKDLNSIVTTWNQGAEHLFGYTAEQMIGKPIVLLIPPDHPNEEPAILDRIRRGESIQHYETVRIRRDGSKVDVALTVSPIRDAGGRIIGASKIARDITERKLVARHADFLSQLSQQLSALADPNEIITAASRAVGVHLQVDRCFFCALTDDPVTIMVTGDWARPEFPPAAGTHQPADFGPPEMWQAMAAGPLGIDDKAVHPLTRNPGRGYEAMRVRAHASAPFLRRGKWIAALVVATEAPHAWRPDEIGVIENALARVWPMVERARSLWELKESERRQRDLMQALPISCYTLDAQGRLTFFNDAAVQLWGRVPSLLETLWCGSLAMTTLDGTPLTAEESPVAVALREKRPVRGVEAFVLRPDGTRRWVVPHPDPIFDADGNCVGVVNVVMDVTEERTAQEKIKKAADQLSLALASANLGDWNWDAATDLITLAPRTCEIYGIPSDPHLTRSRMRDLLHEDDRDLARTALRRSMETRTDYDIEYRVNHPDGLRWVAAKGRSFYDSEGQVLGMVGVAQDITARKQAEIELQRARDEALAASQAKDEFLAALSHELRTPLNPVLLLASSAMTNPDLPPAIRADFDLIHKNVALEARLIDDLLDLTRITHGKLKLDQHRCDLHVVLRDALANVQPEVAEKHLRVVASFKAKECTVLGDSVRLQQVFWNILKNAVKFTPEKGLVSVTTEAAADQGTLIVKITDTGIGMTAAEIDRIFLAFTQGDHATGSSASHRFGGLGLGLAITKMLVEMHGGRVGASSEGLDQGSTFTIELPLCRALATRTDARFPGARLGATTGSHAPVTPSPRRAGATTGAPQARILLVEDHAPTRLTLLQLLRHRQFVVTPAASADEAYRHALASEFDLVISDVGLPGRNGYELMADLRRLNPRLAGIALSGYGMEDDLVRSQAAGFSVHLVKPVTMERLEEAIASLLPSPAGAPTSNLSPA